MNDKKKPEELAQKAIKLLEVAGKYEAENDIEKAIEIYQEAQKCLIESGYLPHRNNDIQDHINELTESLKEKKVSQKIDIKKEVDNLQKEGFSLLEQGENFEAEGFFEKAIKKYESAVSLLKEAGWSELQLNNVKYKIRDLNANLDKESIYKKKREVQYDYQKVDNSALDSKLKKPSEINELGVEIISDEDEIKAQAFNLIDKGKELEKNEKYDEAIDQINQAIELFKLINWDSYIQPIKDSIAQILEKKEMKNSARQYKKMREEKIHDLIESMDHKQVDNAESSPQDRVAKLHEYELTKQEKEKRESIFFELLDNADKLVNKGNYDDAILEYKKALEQLNNMGFGWDYYIPTIQNTIDIIESKRESSLRIEYQQKQQQDKVLKQKEEFQEYVSKKLSLEMKELENRELLLREKEEEKEYLQKRKDLAFNYLNSAEQYVINQDFDNAIFAYQNAADIFAEIQWNDELIMIENSINDIQKKKEEQLDLKNKQMEQQIEKLKEEEEFQNRINQNIKLERNKLQQRELTLKERERSIKIQEFEREKALKLLEKAQELIEMGDLDNALENYENSRIILNQINFPTNIVDEMIYKVQDKRRKIQIEKQRELESQIKKEQEHEEFQLRITRSLDKEKEKLKEKQIKIQEYEERKQSVEQIRQEAFNILDQAEALIERADYDQAIKLYRKSQIMLNRIQFPTNSIEETINKIVNLKEQNERQKQLQYKKEIDKLEQDKALNILLRERKRKESSQMLTENIIRAEREEIIQKQMTHREAAYSLLDKAGKYLKMDPPGFKKAMSLYIEARDLLAKNVGWEPEIKNLTELVNDLKKEESEYFERKNRERSLELQKQREHESYVEEIEKRKLELTKKQIERQERLREYTIKQETLNQLQSKAFDYIDKGKELASYYRFQEAYEMFNKSIATFKSMGWNDQIKYIEIEINNIRDFEEKVNKAQISRKLMEERLEEQKLFKEQKISKQAQILRETISDVGNLTDEVSIFIKREEEISKFDKLKKSQLLKNEAKKFGASMKKLIKLKEDLLYKLKEAKEQKLKEEERIQKEKERKDVDEIKKMLKETMKKK